MVPITRLPPIRFSVTQFRRLPHRLGLSGSGWFGGDLRLRRLPQRHLPWQPAMTRYEAAALLNACPDRHRSDRRAQGLLKEFETELAILKGRVDGLEARVGELEATQFSTTTKLKGKANFVVGAINSEVDSDALTDDAFSFAYDYRLSLKTSFTGKDLLFSRLRSNNQKNGDGVTVNAFAGGLGARYGRWNW